MAIKKIYILSKVKSKKPHLKKKHTNANLTSAVIGNWINSFRQSAYVNKFLKRVSHYPKENEKPVKFFVRCETRSVLATLNCSGTKVFRVS